MKTYEVTALVRVFARLKVEATSEPIARAKAANAIKNSNIESYEDHTAELDTIESVTECDD